MNHIHNSVGSVRLIMATVCLLVGLGVGSLEAAQTEVLRITVGKPTFLSPQVYQNRATVAVSRTGVVAVFYPNSSGPKYYRTSTDGGRTWSQEMQFAPQSTSFMSVGLREGGVLFMTGCAVPVKGGKPGELEASRIIFSDDFITWQEGRSPVFIPNAALNTRWAEFWPPFDKGKIVQLPNGDLMAPMYGNFTGDLQYRTMFVRSTDSGKSWNYHDSIYHPQDPDSNLVGSFCGYCEPSLARLADGRFMCAMRTQGAQWPGEYRPIYVSWSDKSGKNWSKPLVTNPHLMNIWPTLAVLDNGVVACQYGRPGVHVAFSLDSGRTWRDQVSFSDLQEPISTGQGDIVKVGPNRLIAVGNDADGVKVWPIDVARVKVSPSRTNITGRITDTQGKPIAGAAIGLEANRYYLDSWTENEESRKTGGREIAGAPVLGYRAISTVKGSPVAKTNARGEYILKSVKLAEYVVTAEANGCAPQWRHINVSVDPKQRKQDFQLKPGRLAHGRVLDQAGKPVGGACVVLDSLHIHAGHDGYFSWAIDAPVPEQVSVIVHRRYDGAYKTFEGKLSPSQIEAQPIVLERTK